MIKSGYLFLFIPLLMISSHHSHAAGDAAVGRIIAKSCQSCHGLDGMNRIEGFPNLAGQNYGYLVNQLEAMRDSAKLRAGYSTFVESDALTRKQIRRSSTIMDPYVIGLSDLAIADVSAFYAGLPCLQGASKAPLPPPQVAVRCQICHDKSGISKDTNMPNLAGQDALYLEQQLKSYKAAKMQAGDGQEKRRSVVMEGQVRSLGDAVLHDISLYYSSLPCNK